MPWASLFLALTGILLAVAGTGLLLDAVRLSDEQDKPSGGGLNRGALDALERPRRIERFVYRHHRLFGSAIVAGSLMLLALLGAYQRRLPETLAWRGWHGTQLPLAAAWALLVFALIIGCFILARPSALKRFESLANRWIEPFPTAAPGPAAAIYRLVGYLHGVPSGIALLLVALFCLVAAAKMAFV